MSPRRARRVEPAAAARPDGTGRPEEHPDGIWIRRPVAGAEAVKAYRCPGCDQLIPPGMPHSVTWPADSPQDRRHWHTACWNARARRRVKVHRAKNAPRYG